jgi:hypothetical protein
MFRNELHNVIRLCLSNYKSAFASRCAAGDSHASVDINSFSADLWTANHTSRPLFHVSLRRLHRCEHRTSDIIVQVALSQPSGENQFILSPSLASVSAAAAGCIDSLLNHMQRSLVQLSVPSLSIYAPESCGAASLMGECQQQADDAKAAVVSVLQRCESDATCLIALLQVFSPIKP